MITNGFTYFATLVLIAGLLVGAQRLTKWKHPSRACSWEVPILGSRTSAT